MDFARLIRKALLDKVVVTIPSIGSLSLQYQTARLVKNEQILFVPPKELALLSTENERADEFVDYVEKESNVSKEQIRLEFLNFALKIKQQLDNQTDYELSNVGVFHTNGSFDSVIFPETYGLSEFSLDKVTDRELKDKKEKPIKIAKIAGKVAFIASPILFGALLVPNILQVSKSAEFASIFRETSVNYELSQPDVPRPLEYKPIVQEESVAMAEIVSEPMAVVSNPKQSIAEVSTETIQTSEKEATVKKSKVEKNSVAVAKPKKNKKAETQDAKYFIIVGTFSQKSNAEKYSKKLKKQAYDSGVLNDSEKSRVYLSAFADKTEAQQYIKNLQSGSEYSDAWLYVKES